ncbi:MAG: ATP-binding protein [Acidimicrobiales bacterium]
MCADAQVTPAGSGDDGGPAPVPPPSPALFADVVGQPRAVSQLVAAARRPVHAYLLHGPRGSGKRAAARGLAAALLCPSGGCGKCNTCRRALAGTHPDLVVVERSGAALDVDEARSIVARAQRHPLESARQVLMIADLHLAERAVPALLKTVEEPTPATVFVLVADDLPSILTTIASRCVQIAFDPVPDGAVTEWLMERGTTRDEAEAVARASGGRLDRAALLVGDPGYRARQEQWRSVPTRLDGSGAAAAVVAAELLASADEVLEPLRGRHAEEFAALADQAELTGARGISGRRQVEERHKREERRWRTDDLRFGLATLAEVYRDRLADTVPAAGESTSAGSAADSRRAARHVEAIGDVSVALGRNANESLMMEALMVELSGLSD